MKQNGQPQRDRHLDPASESNGEKHINFPEVEEDGSEKRVSTSGTSERQKQWREQLKEGEEERQTPAPGTSPHSSIAMDNDDTLGIP